MNEVNKKIAVKLPPLEALEGKIPTHPQPKETYHDKFRMTILDQDRDYPAPIPVLNLVQNDQVISLLTLKSFSLWQGKQKSKKTTLLAMAIAAYINPKPSNDLIRMEAGVPGAVLFFDCEQGESYAAKTMKLILKLADLKSSGNLIYSDLRQHSPEDRVKIIQAGIEVTANVKIIIIDGIVDLLMDFMEAREGHTSITNIIRICSEYDVHIAGVLHQNKADKNARAHVGSISSQKCEVEISAEVNDKDKAESIITCVNSRDIPFEPFAIRWERGSLPYIVQEWNAAKGKDEKLNQKLLELEILADELFLPALPVTRTDAERKIQNYQGVSEATANRRVNELMKAKFIYKAPDGRYHRTEK